MVRRFYRANGAVIRGGGGLPWNYTPFGIDLGKTVFHLVGPRPRGEVVVRKSSRAHSCVRFTANVPRRVDWHGACGGSHFLGRALREQSTSAD